MNKWLLITLAVLVIPFVVVYMWVRHPCKCWREAKRSWLLVFRGKDIE